jgi:hypothetical protein
MLAASAAAAWPADAALRPCQNRPAGLRQLPVDSWLNGVSVLSGCDAWAVGGYADSQGNGGGLIEHWNGSSWSHRLVPGIEGLDAVAALSRSDAWAVGSKIPHGPGIDRALILHWNGRTWKPVPVPDTGHTKGSALTGVSAVSPRDVWAVGEYQFGRQGIRDLIEHWNGRSWSRLQGPRGPGVAVGRLESLTAVRHHHVRATGGQSYKNEVPGAALIRWNGRNWHKVRLPRPDHALSIGFGQVTAISLHDAWAVGSLSRAHVISAPLAMRWNGRAWHRTPMPAPSSETTFTAVAAISPANVWAVGSYGFARGKHFLTRTLIEHWNGRSWRIARSPNPDPADDELNDIAGSSASDIWAVGQYSQAGLTSIHPIAVHCCRWRVLPPPS